MNTPKLGRPQWRPSPPSGRFTLSPTRSEPGAAAFTRLELVGVLTAVALLAAIALPVLAGSRTESDRLGCVSNLRHVGQAYQRWANEHEGYLPIALPYWKGGLNGYPGGMLNNAWFHYAWISNELVTARVLACPGDVATKVARDFSGSPDGGFVNPAFRGNALSYFTTLEALPGQTVHFISGDRNIRTTGGMGGDASGVTTALSVDLSPTTTGWLPDIHAGTGNLLLYDGRVLQTSGQSLRNHVERTLTANGQSGNLHILQPRW